MNRALPAALLRLAILTLVFVIAPGVLFAQHSGGCACGTPSGATTTWELEVPSSYNSATQTEMAKWNKYADVFRVTTGNGTMGLNSVNEIGFLDGTTSGQAYGEAYTLASNVFGVCVMSPQSAFGSPMFNACPIPSGTTCGTFTETDVVLNNTFSRGWTASGYPDFDDNNGAANVNATVVHELGHSFGLHHNFTSLSTMNYFEDFAAWYVTAADAEIARLHLPARAQTSTDLGIYPFLFANVENKGYQSTTPVAISPSTVVQGGSLGIQNFTLENLGTTNLTNVMIRFYLTSDRTVTTGDHEIGSLSFSSVSSLQYYDGSAAWNFNIPASMPAGNYYVGSIVMYNTSTQDTITYNNSWVTEAQVTVTDANMPTVTITGPTSASSYVTTSQPVTISGTASDNTGVTSVTWSNGATGGSGTASGTTSWSASVALAGGANHIVVNARDAASNIGSDTIVVTLDNAQPSITISTPTSASSYYTTGSSITLSGSASDSQSGLASVTWSSDRGYSGSASGTANWTASSISLLAGANLITVRATDAAGLTSSDQITVYRDTGVPSVIISTPTIATTYSSSSTPLTIAGSASDDLSISSVTWASDRGFSGTATGTASWSFSAALASGVNNITVTATDAAGRTSTDSIAVTYSTAESTPPSIAITSPTSSGSHQTTASTISLGGTASDNVGVSTVTWSNAGTGLTGTATGTTNWSITGISLALGSNSITVRAYDAANNSSAAVITVTRGSANDTTPPSVTITSPAPPRTSAGSSITIAGTATDDVGVGSVMWLDSQGGSGTATGTTSWSFTAPVAFGTTIFLVRAVDGASNYGSYASVTVVRRSRGDFGADGKAELLWRKGSTGETALWTMNGLTVTATTALPSIASEWSVQGVEDFDGDARADILWRNASTGALYVWRMNGATLVASEPVTSSAAAVLLSPAWVIETVGDFNADAAADILVRNTTTNEARVWLMNAAAIVSNDYVAAPSPQWSVQGVGDFSGDGKADILWRNSSNNEAWAWLMNGATIAGTGYVASPPDIWSVKGVGDFSGDGRSDILWRNSSTNEAVVWTMNSTSISAAGYVATPPSIWDIRAVGDFNGDSRSDMMWRNTSGDNVLWLMNGLTISSSGYITGVADQAWTVVGPR